MPRRIQNDAGAFSGKVEAGLPLENAPIIMMARGLTAKPVPTFADHALHIPEQCLCFGINRGAQNCSRTSLKMLTLLRCVARLPFGDAVGFLVLGVHV